MPQPDRISGDLPDAAPETPRQRLLDCAARLFREKGYERTTVRDIGAAVGIQSGSIFHHFSSKEDILKAVMSEALIYFTDELRASVESQSGALAKLQACIHSELQFTVGDDTTAIMSLLITEWRSLGEANQKDILEYRAAYEQLWMDVLEEAKSEGLIEGDCFVLRRLLAGAIHWTRTWYDEDGELSLDALSRQTLQLACVGGAIS
jgi:TetR/AcrR family transcriptional regulator, cholesterol catabolism regulator